MDLMVRLEELRKEGSEKFATLSAAGNAVRSFSDAKRENSADEYNIARINELAVATLDSSIEQIVQVHNMFAHPEEKG